MGRLDAFADPTERLGGFGSYWPQLNGEVMKNSKLMPGVFVSSSTDHIDFCINAYRLARLLKIFPCFDHSYCRQPCIDAVNDRVFGDEIDRFKGVVYLPYFGADVSFGLFWRDGFDGRACVVEGLHGMEQTGEVFPGRSLSLAIFDPKGANNCQNSAKRCATEVDDKIIAQRDVSAQPRQNDLRQAEADSKKGQKAAACNNVQRNAVQSLYHRALIRRSVCRSKKIGSAGAAA